jgi:hypothetical protein
MVSAFGHCREFSEVLTLNVELASLRMLSLNRLTEWLNEMDLLRNVTAATAGG